MDLREFMTIDKEYYKPSKKSPVVIRMMHARLRTTNCIFDAVYMICILISMISKKLSLKEEISASQQEVPHEPLQLRNFLPKQIKQIEKIITQNNLLRFVSFKNDAGSNFSQAFNKLSLEFEDKKPDWIQFHTINFIIPLPQQMQLQTLKYFVLQHTEYLFQRKRF